MTLVRDDQNDVRTLGAMIDDDGTRVCETLELPWRDNQHDISCVPEGEYECRLAYSPSHKRDLYWLQDVPGRGCVEIHIGNTVHDTKGCILLGTTRTENGIVASRWAFEKFMKHMDGKNFTLSIVQKLATGGGGGSV